MKIKNIVGRVSTLRRVQRRGASERTYRAAPSLTAERSQLIDFLVEQELSSSKLFPYTAAAVWQLAEQLKKNFLCVVIKCDPSLLEVQHKIFNSVGLPVGNLRANAVLNTIKMVKEKYPTLCGTHLFIVSDQGPASVPVPVLVPARTTKHTRNINIPDYDLSCASGTVCQQRSVFPRYEKLLFRGASTGSFFTRTSFHALPRIKFCLQHQNSTAIDAKITSLVQCSALDYPHIFSYLRQQGVLGDSMSIAKQGKFKYLAVIDGNCGSWSRMRWILASKSVMFKHIDNNHSQWYYPLLKPYEHYLPFTFANVTEQINYAQTKPELMKMITSAANELCWVFKQEAVLYYLFKVLNRLAALQQG
jgi:hypothetical protein